MKTSTVVSIIAILIVILLIVMLLLPSPEPEEFIEICDGVDNDGDGQVDEGFVSTCSVDADCGPSGVYGKAYCRGDDVYQGFYVQSCGGEIGTCLSECSSSQTEILISSCENGCLRGACRPA